MSMLIELALGWCCVQNVRVITRSSICMLLPNQLTSQELIICISFWPNQFINMQFLGRKVQWPRAAAVVLTSKPITEYCRQRAIDKRTQNSESKSKSKSRARPKARSRTKSQEPRSSPSPVVKKSFRLIKTSIMRNNLTASLATLFSMFCVGILALIE